MTDTQSSDRPWLVIIDMQNIFNDPTRWPCPAFNEIVEPILNLAAKFGDRILLTRFIAGANHVGSWVPYYAQFPFAIKPDSDETYDIVDSLKNLCPKDEIISLTTFNKWGDEQRGLRAVTGNCPRLVLTGVATDCCVLSTAMAAAEAGAFVTVVLDACAGSTPENQLAAESILRGYAPLIQITTTLELLQK